MLLFLDGGSSSVSLPAVPCLQRASSTHTHNHGPAFYFTNVVVTGKSNLRTQELKKIYPTLSTARGRGITPENHKCDSCLPGLKAEAAPLDWTGWRQSKGLRRQWKVLGRWGSGGSSGGEMGRSGSSQGMGWCGGAGRSWAGSCVGWGWSMEAW